MFLNRFQTFSITILSSFLLFNISLAASDDNQLITSQIPQESLANNIASTLPHHSPFEISSIQHTQSPAHSFINNDLRHIRTYTFTSKRPVSENTQNKTHLRFTLSIMTYESPSAAEASTEKLLASSDPDTGLSYAWDYVIAGGTSIYWLHAPCLLSGKDWQRLKITVQKHVSEKESPRNNSSFECSCGRNCYQN